MKTYKKLKKEDYEIIENCFTAKSFINRARIDIAVLYAHWQFEHNNFQNSLEKGLKFTVSRTSNLFCSYEKLIKSLSVHSCLAGSAWEQLLPENIKTMEVDWEKSAEWLFKQENNIIFSG
jgi:hypothetical protein